MRSVLASGPDILLVRPFCGTFVVCILRIAQDMSALRIRIPFHLETIIWTVSANGRRFGIPKDTVASGSITYKGVLGFRVTNPSPPIVEVRIPRHGSVGGYDV